MTKGSKKEKIDLETIVENLPGYIYWKNSKSQYIGCNRNLAHVSGLTRNTEIVGKTDADFEWGKDQAESFRQDDQEVMASGITKITEHVLPIPSGDSTQKYVRTEKIPLRNKEGEVVGVLGVAIDISDLKQAQDALNEQIKKTEEAYRSKSEFLATASHEIRNPVSNIIYSVDSTNELWNNLKNAFYDEIDLFHKAGKQEEMKKIQSLFKQLYAQNEQTKAESHRALNSLINLGELHRLQTESTRSRFELSNINELITLAIDNSTYPNKSKVDIHININPDVPQEMIVDYNNVYEALRVIIGNAIRFSETDGIVKINVNSEEQQDKSLLFITVQDYGVGIAKSQLEHIFETLLSISKDTPSNYLKPSLQLPQAKMRVEASGGTLEIISALKEGTSVIIKVPYSKADSNIDDALLDEEDRFSEVTCSILLVEDDVFAQKMVKHYLEEHHHEVDIASTSAEAVELARQKNYDIILMDITLPDRNGVETKKLIQEKVNTNPIFIAVTSHAAEHDADYFISQGFVTVLAKPVNKSSLKKCINSAIIARVSEDNEDD